MPIKKQYIVASVIVAIALLLVVSILVFDRGDADVALAPPGINIGSCQTLSLPGATYILEVDVSTTGTCFTITANNITLEGGGFTITGDRGFSDYGISASGVNGLAIRDLVIDDFGKGINFDQVNHTLIERVNFTQSSGGGAFFEGATLQNSHHNHFDTVFVNWTPQFEANGIALKSSLSNVVSNSTIIDAWAGVKNVESSHDTQILHNYFSGHFFNAITLDADNSYILNNTVFAIGLGDTLTLSGGDDHRVVDTTIVGGANGLRIEDVSNTIIEGGVLDGLGETGTDDAAPIRFTASPGINVTIKDVSIINTNPLKNDLTITVSGIDGLHIIDTMISKYNLDALVSGVTIEDSTRGKISFNEGIIGGGSNFSHDIRIADNVAAVESDNNAGFNVSAQIELRGLGDISNPSALRDGQACAPEFCSTVTTLGNGAYAFNVTSWTTYSIDTQQGGGDAIPLSACGALTTPDAIYELQNNITETGTCFTVEADNITLEGNGFAVQGGGPSNSVVEAINRQDISIRNLVIVNYGKGIVFNTVTNSLIDSVSVDTTTVAGIEFTDTTQTTLQDSLVMNSLLDGVVITNGANNSIVRVQSDSNGRYGISLTTTSQNSIVDSEFGANSDGIFLSGSTGNTIENSTSSQNARGLVFGANSDNNIVYNLTVDGNTNEGISITASSDNTIMKGSVANTGTAGIILGTAPISNIILEEIALTTNTEDLTFVTTGLENIQLVNMQVGPYSFFGDGNAIVVRTDQAEIRFLEPINGSGTSFDEHITAGFNLAEVQSDVNTGLNASANVTFYNDPSDGLTNLELLRDDQACPADICHAFTALDAETVIFNVSHWTSYRIGGDITTNEDPDDGGSNDGGGGGGGSGGGGSSSSTTTDTTDDSGSSEDADDSGSWSTVASVTYAELETTQTISFGTQERIEIIVDGVSYFIGVISLTSDSLLADLPTATLQLGVDEERTIDIDGDGIEDVTIVLTEIAGETATVTLRRATEGAPAAVSEPEASATNVFNIVLIVISTLILLLVIAVILVLRGRRKKAATMQKPTTTQQKKPMLVSPETNNNNSSGDDSLMANLK